MPQLPRKTANYSVFGRGGRELLGLADVTAPNIQNLQDTYKGAGVFGEVNVSIQAHFQPIEVSLNWHQPTADAAFMYIQDGADLDLWMASQYTDSSNNRIVHKGWRLQMLTMPSGFDFGTIEVGASSSSVSTFQVTRFLASFDDKEQILIDVDNQECRIQGNDVAARIRQLIGKN
jgi:Bacteriophage tail tube protein